MLKLKNKTMKENLEFWKLALVRAFTLFGFTFFATIITLKDIIPVLQASFIGAGLYFFTELMKYYKLQPDKKVLSKSNKKCYAFLI